MNTARWIAQRIGQDKNIGFSRAVEYIAVGSIALGLSVLIVSFSIFEGFKSKLTDKICHFSGHFQLSGYDSNLAFDEAKPISTQNPSLKKISQLPFFSYMQPYTKRAALLKSDTEVAGVILKGVEKSKTLNPLEQYLTEGTYLNFPDTTASNDLILSEHIAKNLSLKLNDSLVAHFVENKMRSRYRKMRVAGIYRSNLEEFDHSVVLCDMRLVQKLNNWPDTLVGGYELFFESLLLASEQTDAILDELDYATTLSSVYELYSYFFDWFRIIDRNVFIFLSIIVFVALFNIISVLLIMIVERIEMIGVLKTIGANNWQLQRIFFYKSLKLMYWGLFFGNFFGLGFCWVQDQWGLIPLDEATYYTSAVPIELSYIVCAILNVIVVLLVLLMMLLPTFLISFIKPVKAIRFQ
ncbi:MAG: ABC transporter permease [Cytophagales bacterium]|nr:MAG: ABC transporter permease [Cytophagales bacterium]TAF61657.1 MAG: ABC transporter permease [Cytophagales bacterium]